MSLIKKHYYLLAILVVGVTSIASAQNVTYKGFLDLNASFQKKHSEFTFGGLDNYIAADITDRLTFVGEVIVQPANGHEFRVDVERIHVTYDVHDYFKIRVGRFYAPIGYYTTHFYSDHAATLTPSISRPAVIAYEDDGGMLETRATGIMISGARITNMNLAYDVAVTNGIGSSSGFDNNNHKAVTLRLSANPVEGLVFGGGVHLDQIDSATVSYVTEKSIDEKMTSNNYSGFVSYQTKNILVMGEFYSISNKSSNAGSHQSAGAFAYAGYTIKDKLTPYVQYDYLKVSKNDIYYTSANNEKGFDLGLKYSFGYQSVIKAEYHIDAKMLLIQYAIGF